MWCVPEGRSISAVIQNLNPSFTGKKRGTLSTGRRGHCDLTIQSWMATVEVVEARAPGKVIISGEHAVVHGTSAVAAALDRYTTVLVKRPPAVIGTALYFHRH